MTKTPKRIITSWICPPDHGSYNESHKKTFYRCLESWHRLMPDYDIRIVNVENIFDYGSDPWAMEQEANKNYIGLSQWARLRWLYELGGVYVDMDVEAIQRFDSLLDGTFFAGHEGGDTFINNAIIGAPKGHTFLSAQLAYLKGLNTSDPQFGNESGPRMLTNLLYQRGWNGQNELGLYRDITIYPSKVFYPYFWMDIFDSSCIVPETIAVHHWASSWVKP